MDKDIFGPPRGYKEVGGDEDIFAPPPQEKKASEAEPEERPRTLGDRVRANPMLLSPWGPAILGIEFANEQLEKMAYKAGGAVTDVATKVLPTERTNPLQYMVPTAQEAGFVSNVGIQALPVVAGSALASKIGAPLQQGAARRVMQSAVKPTLSDLESGKAGRAVETMLREGVNPSEGGVLTLAKEVSKQAAKVNKAIEATGEYVAIDKSRVAARLDELAARAAKQVNPADDLAAIAAAKQEFLANAPSQIPVKLAQEMKSGTYKALGEKAYGEMKGIAIEAQKTLARGLKEEVSAAMPEVTAPLARESDLLNAINVMKRRALMSPNKDLSGMAMVTQNPYAWTAMMADRSAAFKALLARALYGSSGVAPATTGAIGGAYMAAPMGAAPGETPMLDLTGLGALYEPPKRGAPRGRTGGGSR